MAGIFLLLYPLYYRYRIGFPDRLKKEYLAISVGFKGFAKPTNVENASDLVGNISNDEFVFYTGGAYGRRRASGRSISLSTITEIRKPIPLADYVKRALKAGPDGKGYGTDISVGGLSLHAGAKPAVYLYLVKDADGNFRAKKDFPNVDPAFSKEPIKAGDIVVPKAKGRAVAKA